MKTMISLLLCLFNTSYLDHAPCLRMLDEVTNHHIFIEDNDSQVENENKPALLNICPPDECWS